MPKQFNLIIKTFTFLLLLTLSSCIRCHHDREPMETPKTNYSIYEVNIKSSLNVRTKPSETGEKIGTLYNNDKVNVINISNGWAKIKYGSQDAYVSSKYLTLINEGDSQIEKKEKNGIISRQETNISSANESTTNNDKKMALVFDNAKILSSEDYMAINQAYSNINTYIVVWTIESIDKGEIIGYNSEVCDILGEDNYKKIIKSNMPANIKEDDIYFITYIKDLGLMQVNSESGAMNIINISFPEKFLKTQLKAKQQGLRTGLIDLSSLINEATKKYKDNNWFVRTYINGSSLGGVITESLFKEHILPSNSFFHKYIFSWVTKIPREFVNFLIALFGSLSYAMVFLCVLYTITLIVKSNILGVGYKQGETKKINYLLLSLVVLSFLFVCLVILIFYTMCNMADITAMKMYGWNNEMITNVLEHNLNNKITRTWWLTLLFFIGMLVYKLPNAWESVAAFLPPKAQQQLAKKNPSHFDSNPDFISKESPYSELLGDKTGSAIGNSIFLIIILTLLLNGTSMMYATVFTLSLMIGKVYSIIKLYLSWKSYGYFRNWS